MKKQFIIGLIIVNVLLFSGLLYYLNQSKGIYVTITNQTSMDLSGMVLTYENHTQDFNVGLLTPNTSFMAKINPDSGPVLYGIDLIYYDQDGKEYSQSVLSYYQTNDKMNVEVLIKSIKTDGTLEVLIQCQQ